MNFLARRYAEGHCDARHQIAMGAIAMHVAARYPLFRKMRVGICIYVCACGEMCVRGSLGRTHDDSLNTRLYSLILIRLGALVCLTRAPLQPF